MKKPSNTKRNSSLSHKVHLQDCVTIGFLLVVLELEATYEMQIRRLFKILTLTLFPIPTLSPFLLPPVSPLFLLNPYQ